MVITFRFKKNIVQSYSNLLEELVFRMVLENSKKTLKLVSFILIALTMCVTLADTFPFCLVNVILVILCCVLAEGIAFIMVTFFKVGFEETDDDQLDYIFCFLRNTLVFVFTEYFTEVSYTYLNFDYVQTNVIVIVNVLTIVIYVVLALVQKPVLEQDYLYFLVLANIIATHFVNGLVYCLV